LVVIFIVMLLAGISIPVIAPTLDSRRLREASRSITAYLQGARDTAMRNGRPVGVMFERYVDRASGSAIAQMSIVLRQVEVPPPYAGDTLTSRMQVIAPDTTLTTLNVTSVLPDVGWQNLIRIGDIVQLNYQGTYYQITDGPYNASDPNRYLSSPPTSSAPWKLTPLGNMPSYLAAGATLPYQIFRQPVKSANPPLQLPESLVIDLQFSGLDAQGVEFSPINTSDVFPVVVMFTPSGTVERIYGSVADGGNVIPTSRPVTAPIHFLLGKRERVNNIDLTDRTPEGMSNVCDLENLWISVHPQSGMITAAPVGNVDNPDFPYGSMLAPARYIAASRHFATNAQIAGGR
jgi:hypothetical protein